MNSIPCPLIVEILQHCDPFTLSRFSQVNKEYHTIVKNHEEKLYLIFYNKLHKSKLQEDEKYTTWKQKVLFHLGFRDKYLEKGFKITDEMWSHLPSEILLSVVLIVSVQSFQIRNLWILSYLISFIVGFYWSWKLQVAVEKQFPTDYALGFILPLSKVVNYTKKEVIATCFSPFIFQLITMFLCWLFLWSKELLFFVFYCQIIWALRYNADRPWANEFAWRFLAIPLVFLQHYILPSSFEIFLSFPVFTSLIPNFIFFCKLYSFKAMLSFIPETFDNCALQIFFEFLLTIFAFIAQMLSSHDNNLVNNWIGNLVEKRLTVMIKAACCGVIVFCTVYQNDEIGVAYEVLVKNIIVSLFGSFSCWWIIFGNIYRKNQTNL